MLKYFMAFLLISVVVTEIDQQQINKYISKMAQKRQKFINLQNDLKRSKQELQACQRRCQNIQSKYQTSYYTERKQKQKLLERITALEDKNKLLQNQVNSKIDDEDSLLYKFKQKIYDLENKLKGKTEKIESQYLQKLALQNKINEYKKKDDFFTRKIKELEGQSLNRGKTHLDEINQIRKEYENRIKNFINSKCDVLAQQIKRDQQACRKESKTFVDKIKNLEQAALSKAKQFAENISNARKEVTNRIKNYLTGKGPYTKQDQQQFALFKQKVNNLEQRIKQRVDETERILKQKEEFDFQQRYCIAKLADYDQQIKQLQTYAKQTGKQYYIDQIQRIQKQKMNIQPYNKDYDIAIEYRNKVQALEQKIRQQQEQNYKLFKQKRAIQQKSHKQNIYQQQKLSALQSENNKLKKQIKEFKRLIQEIYNI